MHFRQGNQSHHLESDVVQQAGLWSTEAVPAKVFQVVDHRRKQAFAPVRVPETGSSEQVVELDATPASEVEFAVAQIQAAVEDLAEADPAGLDTLELAGNTAFAASWVAFGWADSVIESDAAAHSEVVFAVG